MSERVKAVIAAAAFLTGLWLLAAGQPVPGVG